MKGFYTMKAKMTFFAASVFSLFSLNASGQSTTSCTIFNQSCADFGAATINFNSGPENFAGGGDFTYNSTNGNFDGTLAANTSDDFVILSRRFVIQNDILAVGFNTTGSTATLNSYTIETVRASDNTILAACTAPSPTAGPICFSISDADQVAGTEVFFRIIINATNSTGSSQTIIFDDFTYNASQVTVLPVSISSFNAKRSNSTVSIDWTTASESNISGFEVQKRSAGNNNFTTVAFVQSKSVNGNSSSALQYNFTDVNAAAEASFYRIKSLDKDGQSRYSEIRTVDGLKNKAKTLIYPNPSNSETVNVVFSTNDQKDIQLTDIQGRVVRSWKSFKGESLKLDNLGNGIYMLRVSNLITSEKEIQKIIVSAK